MVKTYFLSGTTRPIAASHTLVGKTKKVHIFRGAKEYDFTALNSDMYIIINKYMYYYVSSKIVGPR